MTSSHWLLFLGFYRWNFFEFWHHVCWSSDGNAVVFYHCSSYPQHPHLRLQLVIHFGCSTERDLLVEICRLHVLPRIFVRLFDAFIRHKSFSYLLPLWHRHRLADDNYFKLKFECQFKQILCTNIACIFPCQLICVCRT